MMRSVTIWFKDSFEHQEGIKQKIKRTNGLGLLVPENGDCEASAIVGFCLEVKLANELGSIERVLISILEGPAILLQVPVDNIDRDDILKTFQSAHKQCAMSLDRSPFNPCSR
jgi:hypothetical protein